MKEWKTKSINSCSYVSITLEEVVLSIVRNEELAKQPRIIDSSLRGIQNLKKTHELGELDKSQWRGHRLELDEGTGCV